MTFGEEQYEMIWCKKKTTKACVKWYRPTWELGLMTVWARPSHIFLTIQKFSTHIDHVTTIVDIHNSVMETIMDIIVQLWISVFAN